MGKSADKLNIGGTEYVRLDHYTAAVRAVKKLFEAFRRYDEVTLLPHSRS